VSFIKRISRSLKRNGLLGTATIAVEKVRDAGAGLRPSVRQKRRGSAERAKQFDMERGVDTGGFIHPTELNVTSPNRLYAVSYHATDPNDFRRAIQALPINFRQFTFVDFGSGKGRTLLLAGEFGFQEIIGVEFSTELHRIAEANIVRVRHAGSGSIRSVCVDATDFKIPDKPLVCYFCNPFGAAVMSQVISNLQWSLNRHPREIYIVYYNAKESRLFDDTNCFEALPGDGWARLWRMVPELSPANAR